MVALSDKVHHFLLLNYPVYKDEIHLKFDVDTELDDNYTSAIIFYRKQRKHMIRFGLIINTIAANARPVNAQGSVCVVNDEEIWRDTV